MSKFGKLPFQFQHDMLVQIGPSPIQYKAKPYTIDCRVVLKGGKWHCERPYILGKDKFDKVSVGVYTVVQETIEKAWTVFTKSIPGRLAFQRKDQWWSSKIAIGIAKQIEQKLASMQKLADEVKILNQSLLRHNGITT